MIVSEGLVRLSKRVVVLLVGGCLIDYLFIYVGAAEAGKETETCVICLEEFSAGDTIRMLPCSHEYHSECIDNWLRTQQQNCPMCKYLLPMLNL